nr:hypothetical protein [Mesorhizobium sp. B2-1-3A]
MHVNRMLQELRRKGLIATSGARMDALIGRSRPRSGFRHNFTCAKPTRNGDVTEPLLLNPTVPGTMQ